MTEDEAKTKWCAYREETAMATDRCIASDCMMWKWQIPQNVRVSDSDTGANREGYCGLAGKP